MRNCEGTDPEEEDRRRVCRERKVLIGERVRHVDRVKGLLFSQGVSDYEPLRRDSRRRLDTLQKTGDGRPLPGHLKAQILRELDRLCSIRSRLWRQSGTRCKGHSKSPRRRRPQCCSIGPEFAAILWSEGLFRHFDNRRQVASYAGLAPTPWQSGSVDREQGVSKAGNKIVPARTDVRLRQASHWNSLRAPRFTTQCALAPQSGHSKPSANARRREMRGIAPRFLSCVEGALAQTFLKLHLVA